MDLNARKTVYHVSQHVRLKPTCAARNSAEILRVFWETCPKISGRVGTHIIFIFF